MGNFMWASFNGVLYLGVFVGMGVKEISTDINE